MCLNALIHEIKKYGITQEGIHSVIRITSVINATKKRCDLNESTEFMVKHIFKIYMVFIGVFGQLVFFAQAYKLYSTKHAADLSLVGFSTGLLSVSSWLIYGIVIKDAPLMIANAVACVGAMAVVVGILLYGQS